MRSMRKEYRRVQGDFYRGCKIYRSNGELSWFAQADGWNVYERTLNALVIRIDAIKDRQVA